MRADDFRKDQKRSEEGAPERAEMYRRMSRADRRGSLGEPYDLCDDGGEHHWQPVSFVFETQLLDDAGRVRVRQPDIKEGRVYVVCMACRTHTYVVTERAGYFLGGPDYSAIGMEDSAGNLPESDRAADEDVEF
jgi:hypothetical protein